MAVLDTFGNWLTELGRRDEGYIARHNPAQGAGYRRLAWLVGLIVILLPLGMWSISALTNECFYDSVSHYFYARWVGAVFVAALAFLGSFLIGYSGENAAEGRIANLAGIFVIVVAIVPTGGIGCEDVSQIRQVFASVTLDPLPVMVLPVEPGQPLSYFQQVWGGLGKLLIALHFIAAAIVLTIMAVFSLFVFTRIDPELHIDKQTGLTLPNKSMRNAIYTTLGFLILCAIATTGWGNLAKTGSPAQIDWDALNLTFWFEALALFAFGISWLLRGRFFGSWLVDRHEIDMTRSASAS